MKAQELDYVRETIDCEGFYDAFFHYSDFESVSDVEFHRLRQAFLDARQELASYLNI